MFDLRVKNLRIKEEQSDFPLAGSFLQMSAQSRAFPNLQWRHWSSGANAAVERNQLKRSICSMHLRHSLNLSSTMHRWTLASVKQAEVWKVTSLATGNSSFSINRRQGKHAVIKRFFKKAAERPAKYPGDTVSWLQGLEWPSETRNTQLSWAPRHALITSKQNCQCQ